MDSVVIRNSGSWAGTAFWSHAFEHIKAYRKKDKTQPYVKHKHGSDNRENECMKPDVNFFTALNLLDKNSLRRCILVYVCICSCKNVSVKAKSTNVSMGKHVNVCVVQGWINAVWLMVIQHCWWPWWWFSSLSVSSLSWWSAGDDSRIWW